MKFKFIYNDDDNESGSGTLCAMIPATKKQKLVKY